MIRCAATRSTRRSAGSSKIRRTGLRRHLTRKEPGLHDSARVKRAACSPCPANFSRVRCRLRRHGNLARCAGGKPGQMPPVGGPLCLFGLSNTATSPGDVRESECGARHPIPRGKNALRHLPYGTSGLVRPRRRVRALSCADYRIYLNSEVRRVNSRQCGTVKRERLDFLVENALRMMRFAL